MTDDNEPRLLRAQHELLRRLGTIINDRPQLDQSLVDKMMDLIQRHRLECRAKGLDFPVLVPIAALGSGTVDFARADLDLPSIRTKIVNFVREHPEVPMPEIVKAFQRAFPDLKPDDVLEKRDAALKANERMIERANKFMSEGDDE